jgi:hypothetical protein
MSNPDRLMREAQEHAETLVEDRGLANARAWAIHCANRSTDGFWSRVVQAIDAIDEAEQRIEDEREARETARQARIERAIKSLGRVTKADRRRLETIIFPPESKP